MSRVGLVICCGRSGRFVASYAVLWCQ